MQLPEGDQTSMTKKQMLARMDVCMGGRVAEELIFGPDEVVVLLLYFIYIDINYVIL